MSIFLSWWASQAEKDPNEAFYYYAHMARKNGKVTEENKNAASSLFERSTCEKPVCNTQELDKNDKNKSTKNDFTGKGLTK